jgi:hypothetical protein
MFLIKRGVREKGNFEEVPKELLFQPKKKELHTF